MPTELGMVVTDLLLESFNDLFEVSYTARMEEELDEIEEGKLDWRVAMAEFYERFQKDLEHAGRNMTDIKRMEKPTDLICEKCGKPMVIKWGKHGSFIACTGYPECTNTRELTVDLPTSIRPISASRTSRNTARTAVVRWCSRRAASVSSSRAPAIPIARRPSRSAASSARTFRSKRSARNAATTWCRSLAATASSWLAATTRSASTSSRRPSE